MWHEILPFLSVNDVNHISGQPPCSKTRSVYSAHVDRVPLCFTTERGNANCDDSSTSSNATSPSIPTPSTQSSKFAAALSYGAGSPHLRRVHGEDRTVLGPHIRLRFARITRMYAHRHTIAWHAASFGAGDETTRPRAWMQGLDKFFAVAGPPSRLLSRALSDYRNISLRTRIQKLAHQLKSSLQTFANQVAASQPDGFSNYTPVEIQQAPQLIEVRLTANTGPRNIPYGEDVDLLLTFIKD